MLGSTSSQQTTTKIDTLVDHVSVTQSYNHAAITLSKIKALNKEIRRKIEELRNLFIKYSTSVPHPRYQPKKSKTRLILHLLRRDTRTPPPEHPINVSGYRSIYSKLTMQLIGQESLYKKYPTLSFKTVKNMTQRNSQIHYTRITPKNPASRKTNTSIVYLPGTLFSTSDEELLIAVERAAKLCSETQCRSVYIVWSRALPKYDIGKCFDDIYDTLLYICRKKTKQKLPLIMCGYSSGATLLLTVMATLSKSKAKYTSVVKRLITFSPVTPEKSLSLTDDSDCPYQILREYLNELSRISGHNVRHLPEINILVNADMKFIKCPVDIIVGEKDIANKHARAINFYFQHVNVDSNLIVLPGAQHGKAVWRSIFYIMIVQCNIPHELESDKALRNKDGVKQRSITPQHFRSSRHSPLKFVSGTLLSDLPKKEIVISSPRAKITAA